MVQIIANIDGGLCKIYQKNSPCAGNNLSVIFNTGKYFFTFRENYTLDKLFLNGKGNLFP
jgi:hypothetical protein